MIVAQSAKKISDRDSSQRMTDFLMFQDSSGDIEHLLLSIKQYPYVLLLWHPPLISPVIQVIVRPILEKEDDYFVFRCVAREIFATNWDRREMECFLGAVENTILSVY